MLKDVGKEPRSIPGSVERLRAVYQRTLWLGTVKAVVFCGVAA